MHRLRIVRRGHRLARVLRHVGAASSQPLLIIFSQTFILSVPGSVPVKGHVDDLDDCFAAFCSWCKDLFLFLPSVCACTSDFIMGRLCFVSVYLSSWAIMSCVHAPGEPRCHALPLSTRYSFTPHFIFKSQMVIMLSSISHFKSTRLLVVWIWVRNVLRTPDTAIIYSN